MVFVKGQPKIGGKQKGYKNPIVSAKEMFDDGAVEGAIEKIRELSRSPRNDIALKASQLILAYKFGSPTQSIEHSGSMKVSVSQKYESVKERLQQMGEDERNRIIAGITATNG